MNPDTQAILTVNSGSSSVKFTVFTTAAPFRRVLEGAIERIGLPGTTLTVEDPAHSGAHPRPIMAEHHRAAADALCECLGERLEGKTVAAVGHRVVYGGSEHCEPELVKEDLIEDLRHLSPFDPEHLPGAILLLEALGRRFPGVPQVACFDTAFHRGLPRVAQMLSIPRRYEAEGIRRWGFHGLSCEFLLAELARLDGPAVAQGRVILAHLGNGASLTAVHGGRSMDTSMGFSPASGVPMGTRSGDIDPGLVGYLARAEGMDSSRFHEMVNFHSGLLGVSEISPDMRDLLERETRDKRAAEAVALFCYQVKKCVGSLAAVLGGLDSLVFAGGIGENAPLVRARICESLEFLGIKLDPQRNASALGLISAEGAGVRVRAIHTDEDLVLAESVRRVLGLA